MFHQVVDEPGSPAPVVNALAEPRVELDASVEKESRDRMMAEPARNEECLCHGGGVSGRKKIPHAVELT